MPSSAPLNCLLWEAAVRGVHWLPVVAVWNTAKMHLLAEPDRTDCAAARWSGGGGRRGGAQKQPSAPSPGGTEGGGLGEGLSWRLLAEVWIQDLFLVSKTLIRNLQRLMLTYKSFFFFFKLKHLILGSFAFFIYLFIYLFMAVLGLRFCERAFSSCGERGPLFNAVRGPLTIAASLVAEHRLQTRRLSSCGSRAQLLRGMWDLPRPGLEPVSPALAGGFTTTAPPGKPLPTNLDRTVKAFWWQTSKLQRWWTEKENWNSQRDNK